MKLEEVRLSKTDSDTKSHILCDSTGTEYLESANPETESRWGIDSTQVEGGIGSGCLMGTVLLWGEKHVLEIGEGGGHTMM